MKEVIISFLVLFFVFGLLFITEFAVRSPIKVKDNLIIALVSATIYLIFAQ